MGNAVELEILSAGKTPKTPYHRSPGRGRHTKRKPTTAFIETDGKGPATITPTLQLFQRRRWGNFGDNAGRNTTTQDQSQQPRANRGPVTTNQDHSRQTATKTRTNHNPGPFTTNLDESRQTRTRQPRTNHDSPGLKSRQPRTKITTAGDKSRAQYDLFYTRLKHKLTNEK